MSFTWPIMLIGLVAAPLLIGVHLWLQRRRRKGAVVVSDAALIQAAVPRSSMLRRHGPVVLLATAIALAAFAAARPTREVTVSQSRSSIVLAFDASSSMCNTDIEPNRLTAAQEAAQKFVDQLDTGARVGLVTFSGLAGLTVPSTDDTDEVSSAIESITVARGTAIGSAILVAIDAIAETNPAVEPTNVELGESSGRDGGGKSGSSEHVDYQPDIIVVLTDGANSRGVDPVVAADEAAARGLRVYTIGFGSTTPGTSSCSSEQLGSTVFEAGPFGGGAGGGAFGGGGPGGANLLEIDEDTLATVADSTGGEYFRAEDAGALRGIFADLPRRVVSTTEEQELSVWFALAAAVLAVAATSLGLLWNRTT